MIWCFLQVSYWYKQITDLKLHVTSTHFYVKQNVNYLFQKILSKHTKVLDRNSIVFSPLFHNFNYIFNLKNYVEYNEIMNVLSWKLSPTWGLEVFLKICITSARACLNWIKQMKFWNKNMKNLPVLSTSNYHLKHSNTCSSFPLPIFRIGIKSLQHVKCLHGKYWNFFLQICMYCMNILWLHSRIVPSCSNH